MTFKEFDDFIRSKRTDREVFSRKKGKAYAHADSRFANFERIGEYLDLPREEILLVYLMKHIDGIISSVKYGKDGGEEVSGRIDDAIVYLEMLQGMLAETKGDIYDNNT